MAISFTTTQAGATSLNFERYLMDKPVKTDRYKDSTLLNFSLAPIDNNFVKLTRGAYITIDSAKYPKWFTGYIINDPALTYLGNHQGQPKWGYRYEATSDEYILSLKPLGFHPPFLNRSMGDIIRTLAERLCPGLFNLTNVQDGPIVAEYTIDPNSKFLDVSQDLCSAANFVLYGNDKKLYFLPQDDAAVTQVLDGDDQHFTPSRLDIRPAGTPILNDITVLGDIEPQAFIREYFVGTGLTATFPLSTGVFGADTYVLIDETFQGNALDGATWTVYDTVNDWLKVADGYLNSLGGNGDFGVRIESASPIPMQGKLRFTHGEWDFVSSSEGVIASLWTQTPASSLTGCLYGLQVSGLTINPIVAGAVDSAQSVTVSTSKRYVLRTIADFAKANRSSQEYSYIDQSGTVVNIGGTAEADTVLWSTIITEIDPTTGQITNQWTFQNEDTLTGVSDYFALYVPLISSDLHATVTGITVSTPLAASLALADNCQFENLGFEDWDSATRPTGWVDVVGVDRESTIVNDGSFSAKLTTVGGETPLLSQFASDFIQAGKGYTLVCRLRKTAGLGGSSSFRASLSGTGVLEIASVPHNSIFSGVWETFTLRLTDGLSSVPGDLLLKLYIDTGTEGESVYVDSVIVMSDFVPQIIGPNEIDSIDNLAPIATIVSGNVGAETKNQHLGVPQYNPGQSQLVFFKDSLTRTSSIPPENQIIRLSYYSAGAAVGRAINQTSHDTEAGKWGDNGSRAVVRADIVPRPRSSAECELAAAALVSENSFDHYEGTYTQWSDYFSAEPRAGAVFQFLNLSNMAPVQAEEINQVVTTLECKNPEHFSHVITFGKPDKVRRLLSEVSKPKTVFRREPTFTAPVSLNAAAVGLAHAPNVTNPSVVGWDDNYVYMDTGQTIGVNGLFFEVRYSDESWGVDDGKNLITRTSSRFFKVPRTLRGRCFFIRQANVGNIHLWSEDQTQSLYVVSSATKSVASGANPDGNYSQICSVSFSSGGFIATSTTLSSSYTNFCASLSIKGTAGNVVTVSFGGQSTVVTLTGQWQRVSVPLTAIGGGVKTFGVSSSSVQSVQLTRFSIEENTLVERSYVKTNANVYGPTSRYSTLVKVDFPAPEVLSGGSIDLDSLVLRPTY